MDQGNFGAKKIYTLLVGWPLLWAGMVGWYPRIGCLGLLAQWLGWTNGPR